MAQKIEEKAPASDKPAGAPSHENDEPKPFLVEAVGRSVDEESAPAQTIEAADKGGAPIEDTGRGPLVSRLEKFRVWMEGKVGAKGVFILDRDGEPIIDDENFNKLHFLARSLAQAYRPVAGEAGNVHVKIGAASYLVVVPVETEFGMLVLGSVMPHPLDANAVGVVARGLSEAARPQRR